MKRTPFRPRRRKPLATNSELSHLELVRSCPCIACSNAHRTQTTRTEAHHIRQGMGMAQKASHFETIPLCHAHHAAESTEGFHAAAKTWQEKHGTERELLEQFRLEVS